MRSLLFLALASFCLAFSGLAAPSLPAAERPNILWFFAEDTSPWMGCYGHDVNVGHTPNIDGLADRGVRFSRAFVPAPVCSPCRSALMGGQNQIRFNAHEHRSSRGPAKIHLPEGMKLLPQLVKESGYFTFNLGKTDYNFLWDEEATYSLMKRKRSPVPWTTLQQNQPFFGQIQTAGGKNNTTNFPSDRKTDPSTVTVPPDYPQNDLYQQVVAQHYDAIRKDDDFIGEVLQGLEKAGLAENTIVVYFGDHGANNLVRHKQMPTEGGLHVPFIIAGPDPYVPAPSVRDDLVNLLDLSATTLVWAGVEIPEYFEGQFLFDQKFVPRPFVAAAKDRLDHTIDRVRSIRTDQYRYTRNYKTDRILLQPQYRDSRDYVVNLRELYASGKLDPKLTEIYFGERPTEEFYDVKSDPAQVNNLAADPKFAALVEQHRRLLDKWLAKGDWGEQEESLEELAYQAQDHKWGKAVNPEYEVVREDHDGDGLSDRWESIQGRDPDDGRLLFTFDCGGWQTEGWTGDPILGNIAGFQGYLDFELPSRSANLFRHGLKLNADQNRGRLIIEANCPVACKVEFLAKRQGAKQFEQVLAGEIPANESGMTTTRFSLPDNEKWDGIIESVQLRLKGSRPATMTIDSISIQPADAG